MQPDPRAPSRALWSVIALIAALAAGVVLFVLFGGRAAPLLAAARALAA